MKYGLLAVLVVVVAVSGCQAGWLDTGGSGMTIQVGTVDGAVTSRLDAIELALETMPQRDLDVMGDGTTWTVAESNRNWTGAALSYDGMRQTAVVQHGRIYCSADYGKTFVATGPTSDWDAIAMSSNGMIQTAADYGGQLHFSTDYGATWTARGATADWESVSMSDDGVYQTALSDNGYVYVSTNSGASFTEMLTDAVRSWRAVGVSASGQWQTVACNRRENEEEHTFYDGGLYVSTNYGATWGIKHTGKDWSSMVVCGPGLKQVACANAGKIYVSGTHGYSWSAKEENRAWRDVTASDDGRRQYAIVAGEPVHMSTDFGATWAETGVAQWWGSIACSGNGAYQLATIQQGPLWSGHSMAVVHGTLSVERGIGVCGVGQLEVLEGTQLVFRVGGVTNVLDSDVLQP
jgi:hypothetical protein